MSKRSEIRRQMAKIERILDNIELFSFEAYLFLRRFEKWFLMIPKDRVERNFNMIMKFIWSSIVLILVVAFTRR